jgi:hypothetical protein
MRSLIVSFTASVALGSVPFGMAMAGEGLAMANPATTPKRHNTYAGLIIFMLMMVVTVQLLLSLVLP